MSRKLSNAFRWILWPLSFLYGLVTYVRNYLYNKGLLNIYQSDIYTINIGNLTIGGTGKTPHIEYLQQLLAKQKKITVLSRGYGRKTKGYREVNHASLPEEVGDEPLQFYKKFGHQSPVFVCEKRVEGIQRIEKEQTHAQVVLLDDAYQHRAIKPHLNLLLTDIGRLFYRDHVLPTGLLREFRDGAKRADAVIVTKCSMALSDAEKKEIQENIRRFTLPATPIFFSGFTYATPIAYFPYLPVLSEKQSVYLVSGIAQPALFEEAAAAYYTLVGYSRLDDHHLFKEEEVRKFTEISRRYPILTTEKDWVKLLPLLQKMGLQQKNFYYWPIRVTFDSPYFDQFILSEVMKPSRV
ncbi:tetraacyldisaccharide 4'-kinase [Runella slithyformis]|uniref:Tetraacyldisaccharide 4'-kinase n=1 Tax=Runella slithyformis (strain ATCC 29530 / DSM 19594 / LMG 11500 / NCIMB 11436 / LSU 4) TaxID=761193 RepID=A0A7U3ZN86_RUNSL|nr:tetraacyldisaccharide 4'-kinase [Runella slithyformis]AEI50330.1 Tetraacyldisaccharide 4'-kinase [Runella slithyformis DSM 19594]